MISFVEINNNKTASRSKNIFWENISFEGFPSHKICKDNVISLLREGGVAF